MKVIITNLITGEERSGFAFAPDAYPLNKISDEEIHTRRELVIDCLIFQIYEMAFPNFSEDGKKNERRR